MIARLVDVEHLGVACVLFALVEHAQHLLQSVVDLSTEQGNLYDDAVVRQTFYKRVRHAFRHLLSVVVISLMVDVDDWVGNVPHAVSQQIDRHHRVGVSFPGVDLYVVFVAVLHAEVLSEAQRLSVQPCFLEFNQDDLLRTVFLTDRRRKVDAEHRKRVS